MPLSQTLKRKKKKKKQPELSDTESDSEEDEPDTFSVNEIPTSEKKKNSDKDGDDDSVASFHSDHLSSSLSAFPNPHNTMIGKRSSLDSEYGSQTIQSGITTTKLTVTKVGTKASPYASSSSSGSSSTTQSGRDRDLEEFRAWKAQKLAETKTFVDMSGEEKITNDLHLQKPSPPTPTERLLIEGTVVISKRKRKHHQIHPGTIYNI
jgi:hypothetical protein